MVFVNTVQRGDLKFFSTQPFSTIGENFSLVDIWLRALGIRK